MNFAEKKETEERERRCVLGPVAFIWVQMEFFLNGRFKSFVADRHCLVGAPAEPRRSAGGRVGGEGDAESVPSRLWLAGATRPKASPIVRLVFIVGSSLVLPMAIVACRLVVFPYFYFPLFFNFFFLSLSLFFPRRDILVLLNNKTAFCLLLLSFHTVLIL